MDSSQDSNPKQQLVERVKDATNVLVTVSTSPSIDQLAACIGLTLLLNRLDKHATAVFSGSVPSTLDFLQPEKTIEKNTDSLRDFIISLDKSKADKLRYKVEENVVKIFITPYRTSISDKDLDFSQGDFNVDVVIALGVSQREQLDQAIISHGRILHDATVVTVSAGKMSSTLGTINWQDTGASSLCEMLVSVSEAFQGGVLDNQMATAFLTGIVAETERFSNTKTNPKVMTMAAQLMAAGANQQLIATELKQPEAIPPVIETPSQAEPAPAETGKKAKNDGSLSIAHDGENEKPVDSGLQSVNKDHEAEAPTSAEPPAESPDVKVAEERKPATDTKPAAEHAPADALTPVVGSAPSNPANEPDTQGSEADQAAAAPPAAAATPEADMLPPIAETYQPPAETFAPPTPPQPEPPAPVAVNPQAIVPAPEIIQPQPVQPVVEPAEDVMLPEISPVPTPEPLEDIKNELPPPTIMSEKHRHKMLQPDSAQSDAAHKTDLTSLLMADPEQSGYNPDALTAPSNMLDTPTPEPTNTYGTIPPPEIPLMSHGSKHDPDSKYAPPPDVITPTQPTEEAAAPFVPEAAAPAVYASPAHNDPAIPEPAAQPEAAPEIPAPQAPPVAAPPTADADLSALRQKIEAMQFDETHPQPAASLNALPLSGAGPVAAAPTGVPAAQSQAFGQPEAGFSLPPGASTDAPQAQPAYQPEQVPVPEPVDASEPQPAMAAALPSAISTGAEFIESFSPPASPPPPVPPPISV